MNKFDHERNIKILEIIVGLKFLYIILASLNIISYYSVSLNGAINLTGSGYLLMILLFVCFIVPFIVVCSKMIYGYTEKTFLNMPRVYNVIEIIVILGLFTVLMSKTGGENSSFKYISMIIILISSIQYSKIISFIIAIAVSLIILSFNFINLIFSKNIYSIEFITSFEADIILVSSLLITSFILSLYIEIEKEHNLKLKELAIKDGLTGLYNHRSFQDMLDAYLNNAKKSNKEVSLLFMDIDNFKHFNDINGHQKGDWLLTKLGRILKETVGDLGIVARYGGEEFAVILYDTGKTKALNLGELIRQNIRSTDFQGQEHQPNGNLTVSIGVSSYPSIAKNKKELIELADNALYRAKSFDKNRVEIYSNILDEKDSDIDKKSLNYIAGILNRINKKDKYTYGHSERVVIYAKKFAVYLNLDEDSKKDLILAAYLHDIGKLEISKELLNKRDKLSEHEFNLLRQHPTLGANLISGMDEFNDVAPIIKYHHEKFDGTGYPSNLKGEEIPYLARILTIIDSFDAMTSKRPYNRRQSYYQAIDELKRCRGKHFDEILVNEFIDMLENEMKEKDNYKYLEDVL